MMRRTLQVLDKVLSFFEEWSLFVAVMAALVTLFVSVVTRYTITYTLTWPEELVREVIVYTTFVGCAPAVKNRALIRIDALPNLVPALKRPLEFLAHFALLGFAGFVTWFGVKMALFQYRMGMKTIILQVPQVVLYSILPLMGILMLCRLVHVLYEDISGRPVHEPRQAEG
jgi:TRAP-type C4-dicarboxylate transport system permease small subunit